MAKTKSSKDDKVTIERRSAEERRGDDRRKETKAVDPEKRKGTRRNVNRRRQIDPTTCERDYTGDEIEFMQAMDAYKRSSGRMFPTCSEILEVVRSLGYERKLAGAQVVASEEHAEGGPLPIESAADVPELETHTMIDSDELDDADDGADFEEDDFGS